MSLDVTKDHRTVSSSLFLVDVTKFYSMGSVSDVSRCNHRPPFGVVFIVSGRCDQVLSHGESL